MATHFDPLDKSSSNTLKRNPKMELSKEELLNFLGYLEGELQAREVVIAVLKSERVKRMVMQNKNNVGELKQSNLALQMDSSAVMYPHSYTDTREANSQLNQLKYVIAEHKSIQLRMAKMLKEMECRHRKVVEELDEEKRKHEHDTAQGDDITYGLEKDRTRLKMELELEKRTRKKLEKDLEKSSEVLEKERQRQKQIVLLLLAERKKLIMKYVEERKRSEDLAQIVSEEKVQMNAMADGLEEESKKSLQMEAELEKQMAQFDLERQHLKTQVLREQRRVSELEAELEKSKVELQALNKQLAEAHQVAMFQASVNTPRTGVIHKPVLPASSGNIHKPTPPPPGAGGKWGVSSHSQSEGAGSPSVATKVVQPTATVSSMPVCAPTTGIARSLSPGQTARSALFSGTSPTSQTEAAEPSTGAPSPRSGLVPAPAPGAKLYATSAGGKLTFHVSAAAAAAAEAAAAAAAAASSDPAQADTTDHSNAPVQPPAKKAVRDRGAPPPVPPNKPVVPPKKDSIIGRKVDGDNTGSKVGKEKAPQVGPAPAPESGISTCSVDSLHASARHSSEHGPGPAGSFDVVADSNAIALALPVSSSHSQTPLSAATFNQTPISNANVLSPHPDPSSYSSPKIPELQPECPPNGLDLCVCPQLQTDLCITTKVDAV